MTDAANAGTPAEPTFESREQELQDVLAKLEDAKVPLEERLGLHQRALLLQRDLEARLEAARQALDKGGDLAEADTAAARSAAGNGAEPYEAIRDRLAGVVATLESESLPLARIVALHREARQLAARCEAILDTAQHEVEASSTPPEPKSASTEVDVDDVPF